MACFEQGVWMVLRLGFMVLEKVFGWICEKVVSEICFDEKRTV